MSGGTGRRFPYEASHWHESNDAKREWYEVLERVGVENVRIRLNQNTDEPGLPMVLTNRFSMPKGFVEEWFKWHEDRKAASDAHRQNMMVIATVAAAVAAVAAAFGTGIQAYYAANPPVQQGRSP